MSSDSHLICDWWNLALLVSGGLPEGRARTEWVLVFVNWVNEVGQGPWVSGPLRQRLECKRAQGKALHFGFSSDKHRPAACSKGQWPSG